LPHHNTFGKSWVGQLTQALPDATLIGIDERTGMINNGNDIWQVFGAGDVNLYQHGQIHKQSKIFSF
jgi:hypothetical protein